jgi:hypothetical protein
MYTIDQIKELEEGVVVGISNETEWKILRERGFRTTTKYYSPSYYSVNTGTWGGAGTSLKEIPSCYKMRKAVMFSEIDFEEISNPLIFN